MAKSASERGVVARGLTKRFGEVIAVEDLSFIAERGKVTALLGPNGAGKSTTMRIITGVIAPDAGECRIGGDLINGTLEERSAAAARIGFLPENGPLYEEMTPRETLRFFAAARGLKKEERDRRVDFVVDRCGLADVLRRPVGKLSKGYRQRVGMAAAIVGDPEVLVLDEPTAGLDPNQLRVIRELIRELGKQKTVLLSTHILQEVNAVCDHVLLINRGQLSFDGSIDELKQKLGGALNEATLQDWFQKETA